MSDGLGPNQSEPAAQHRPRLLFIKPPKTASTSVVEAIDAALGTDLGRARRAIDAIKSPGVQVPDDVRFLHAHVSWRDVETLVAGPAAWAPMITLRDPLERTLSYYRYPRQRARRPVMPEAHRQLSEEALVRPLRDLIHDGTSGFFGWTLPVQSLYLGGEIAGIVTEQVWPEATRDPEFQRVALNRALDRLDRLAWIGLAETLERDMQTLAWSQGWPPLALPHANRTARPSIEEERFELIDGADRRALMERLAGDYLLIESARELAAERHRWLADLRRPSGIW